jgi:ribokinase
MKEYDFVAIGDTVIDAFIRLKDAEAHCDIDGKNCKLSMNFGAKIPYEAVHELPAVGNSANASVAAARLGLSSALITNIGDDTYGDKCITHLKDDGVSTEYVVRHEGKKTNYHYVLWFQDERTILIKHEAYHYTFPTHITPPKWIYLSSFAKEDEGLHDTIAEYLQKHPAVRLAFQPGTFQLKLGLDRLKALYAHTEVFVCNVEEAQELLGDHTAPVKDMLRSIHAHGPKIVLITDGKLGAYLLHENKTYFMPPYPDTKPPLERTGAGDAFASTFVAAIALGLSPEEAIRWAPINSASVVQYVGAQKGLLTREELEQFLRSAPETYKLQEIV